MYGRIGTCTQEFGTLVSWLVDVVNVCTGNLDRPGGAMFTRAATSTGGTATGKGRGVTFGRRTSRVRGLPEYFGELPVVALAEEIETPGDGRIRALVTIAGNPAVSTPNSDRMQRALATLDFMVSFDIYVNETTRHANVILPPEPELARGHYDLALYNLAIRNVANYSPPLVELEPGEVPEWQSMLRLAGVIGGQGAYPDIDALDELVVSDLVQRAVARKGSNVEGRDADELEKALATRRGPERVLDAMLRTGPYGDGFGADPDGLSLAKLEANPHGIDLGPLEPRIPGVLRTPTGMIELAPEICVADVERLRAVLDRPLARDGGPLLLVGRRDLRSNNSWMHNLPVLVKGKARCTVHVHPDDAARLGFADGASVRVSSSAGEIVLPAEVTDAVMQGVVSIPHGWGHDVDGTQIQTATRNAGANSNVLGQLRPVRSALRQRGAQRHPGRGRRRGLTPHRSLTLGSRWRHKAAHTMGHATQRHRAGTRAGSGRGRGAGGRSAVGGMRFERRVRGRAHTDDRACGHRVERALDVGGAVPRVSGWSSPGVVPRERRDPPGRRRGPGRTLETGAPRVRLPRARRDGREHRAPVRHRRALAGGDRRLSVRTRRSRGQDRPHGGQERMADRRRRER